MDKALKNRRNQIRKTNRMDEWTLAIVGGLLLAALAMVAVFDTFFLFILIVPLLILPVFYSFHILHTGIASGKRLTFKNTLRFFSLYFKKPNNSSFSFLSSLLKTLIAFFILNFFITIITSVIYYNLYPELVKQFMDEFLYGITNGDYDKLRAFINENQEFYVTFTLIIELSSFFLASFVFFHSISFNSLSIYLRLFMKSSPELFVSSVFKYTIKRNKKAILKDYFYLVWPIYLLFATGLGVGTYLLTLYTTNDSFIIVVALSCGIFLSSLYFPFYFSSKEAIFEKYHTIFQLNSITVAEELMNRLQVKIDITKEESDAIKDSLNNMKNPLEDDEEEKDDKTDDISSWKYKKSTIS